MAWKDAYGYVRALTAGKGVGGEAREDGAVPLGARIGSVVQMQHAPVIRAQAGGSLIAPPAVGDTRVLAISQVRLEPATRFYRLYLSKGDGDDRESFLQVFAVGDAVEEILYCTRLARVIPETADDQDAYTGAAGAGLGDAAYTLWREQLADMLDDVALAAVFGDADHIAYSRDAGTPDAPFVPPFTGHEVRIDDARGMHGLRQQVFYMPYVRPLQGGGREYLLIMTEIVESVDGDARRRGIHVDFMIGIPIEQERVVVQ
jgi:hypothetical protein